MALQNIKSFIRKNASGKRSRVSPFKRRLKKNKVIGEGLFGRVVAVDNNTVRKEYKSNLLTLNKNKKAIQESSIQKKAARVGSAPRIKKVGDGFFEMERLRGQTLKNKLKDASPRSQEVLGKRVAKKVRRLHDQGISHRDLHLDNIFVSPLLHKPKVIDYGLAKDYNRPLKSRERSQDYRHILKKSKKYPTFQKAFKASYIP